jgi:hypothetical protein
MTFFQSRLGAQQGFGTLKFVFDDSNPRSTRGAANVSFRRRGGVRQVNVGLTNFRIKPATEEPRNAIYSYLHFPDRRGRFMYQTKTDAFGEAESTIGVDVAFTAFGSGRGIALLPPKENVENERVMIEECWDPMLSVTFQTSTPEIPRFVDGERKSCPESLANIELRPPTEVISDPNDVRTPLPEKHPLEED